MKTVTQLQQELQDLLRVTARQAGRASGFIQRERKLSGESFVASLVWGWLANPEATLSTLSQSAAFNGVAISPQGLAKRMTARAADCLRQVLEASLLLVAEGNEASSRTFLEQFKGVYLLDSTELPLPLAWVADWPGGGNQHQARAGMKLQTLWDYVQGGLQVGLYPARGSDVRLPVPALPPGALRISDCGYFKATTFQTLDEAGCFYLTRVPGKVCVYDDQGTAWPLADFLAQHARPDFDGWVTLTAHGLRCRLLACRVPPAVIFQRRARARQDAKRKGHAVSPTTLALAEWTVLITNVPLARLSFDQALLLLRLRWQIELLFKLWKQQAQLETSRSAQPERILCELYAKLLGLILQHALLLVTAWNLPQRSLVKLAQALRPVIYLFVFALWQEVTLFQVVALRLQALLLTACRLDTRKAQPSHFQELLSLS